MKALILFCLVVSFVGLMAPEPQVYEVLCQDSTGTVYPMRYVGFDRKDITEEIFMCGTDEFKRVGQE